MTNVKKIITASCLVVVGLTLSSCESLAPNRAAKLPLTPVKKEQADVTIEQLQNKAPVTVATPTQPELFPGTNRFVPDTTTQHRKIKGRGEGEYSLNFDEADLGEVAKVILSDILGQNYVLSPKVAGKVTLQTTDPLSKEELIPTLEMLLRMNNAVLIKDASIYHIEPASEALYSSSFATPGTAGRAGFQVRVIPVRNVAVQNIVDVIKPLVQEKTILNVDSTRNMLIVSGTPDELGRVMDMVSTFDVDVLKGQSFGLFPLAHVEPETVIKELEEIFSKDGKEGEGEFFRFIAVERLNAVMAITHRASYLKDIESWIFRLDRANTASGGGVNVYRVQHVDAEELASTLNEIFTGASKKEKSAKVAPGQQAAELSNKAPEKQNVQKISGPTGDVDVADVGDVRIISDAANNSVVIVATPQDYEVILPVIKQLDVLPLQVLIDATIVSVALTGDLRYGISWYLSQGNDALAGTSTPPGKVADILGTAAQAAAAAATGGFSAIYSSGSVKALLNAQATANNLNVISSPSLMVLNNQQAKINVGDQVPVQTSTTQLPIAGGTEPSIAQSSSIQYIDTGVTLEVTPRVNANGMVIMEIKQIVSNAKPSTTGVTTTVTIAKKEIESSVAVHDGETIVLGGLIDDNNAEGNAGIPYLQDIPWIGSLFGGRTFTRAKTELVVLITPRVVKSKQDSRLISDEFKRKLTGIYESRPVVSTGSVID
ncbi:MAG: type II secretion system secretin GspD [Methylobacter sp.]|nr:type II secretion system secretin GspD [Methylobacter sp.]